MNQVCFLCLQPSKLKCSRCLTIQYCSKECQKQDWKVHKNNCKDNNSNDSIDKLINKAESYTEQGNYAKAEKLYLKLLASARNQYGENHRETFTILNNLANCYSCQGKNKDAGILLEKCFVKRKSLLGDNRDLMANYLNTYLV